MWHVLGVYGSTQDTVRLRVLRMGGVDRAPAAKTARRRHEPGLDTARHEGDVGRRLTLVRVGLFLAEVMAALLSPKSLGGRPPIRPRALLAVAASISSIAILIAFRKALF